MSNIITLTNDKEKSYDFRHIATIKLDNKNYLLLAPIEIDVEDKNQVTVFEIKSDKSGEYAMPVEYAEITKKVKDAFVKKVELYAEDLVLQNIKD